MNRFFSSEVGPYPGELGKNPGALVSPFGEPGKQAKKKKCPPGEMQGFPHDRTAQTTCSAEP